MASFRPFPGNSAADFQTTAPFIPDPNTASLKEKADFFTPRLTIEKDASQAVELTGLPPGPPAPEPGQIILFPNLILVQPPLLKSDHPEFAAVEQ
jgi:hypothetical protein